MLHMRFRADGMMKGLHVQTFHVRPPLPRAATERPSALFLQLGGAQRLVAAPDTMSVPDRLPTDMVLPVLGGTQVAEFTR
eukprot:2862645-Rhodomonas_salina.4